MCGARRAAKVLDMKLAAIIGILIAGGLAAAPAEPASGGPAANLVRAIRELRFDRDSCYRVRDLEIVKEDIRIYLNDGHLILSKPLAGKPIAAVFAADVEGGDGEVLLLAPDRAERTSLAAHTHSPNLDEHFQSALFVFTGDDARNLQAQIAASPSSRKSPEVGALMDEEWSPLLHNLSGEPGADSGGRHRDARRPHPIRAVDKLPGAFVAPQPCAIAARFHGCRLPHRRLHRRRPGAQCGHALPD